MVDAKLIEKKGEWILHTASGIPKECWRHPVYPNGKSVICSNVCSAFQMEAEIPIRYDVDQVILTCTPTPTIISGVKLVREGLKPR